MHTISYHHSADPLVRLIQNDPLKVFDRPYAAYLIFLIGSADREASDWLRTQMIALDSLTGPDIAGIVFAKKVQIDVTTSTEGKSNGSEHLTELPISKVMYSDKQHPHAFERFLTVPHLRRDETRSVAAITYAADDVARALGVVGER